MNCGRASLKYALQEFEKHACERCLPLDAAIGCEILEPKTVVFNSKI